MDTKKIALTQDQIKRIKNALGVMVAGKTLLRNQMRERGDILAAEDIDDDRLEYLELFQIFDCLEFAHN